MQYDGTELDIAIVKVEPAKRRCMCRGFHPNMPGGRYEIKPGELRGVRELYMFNHWEFYFYCEECTRRLLTDQLEKSQQMLEKLGYGRR